MVAQITMVMREECAREEFGPFGARLRVDESNRRDNCPNSVTKDLNAGGLTVITEERDCLAIKSGAASSSLVEGDERVMRTLF
jgi:hypothetical protein